MKVFRYSALEQVLPSTVFVSTRSLPPPSHVSVHCTLGGRKFYKMVLHLETEKKDNIINKHCNDISKGNII